MPKALIGRFLKAINLSLLKRQASLFTSQFGYYGSQLGDNVATISRERQQKLMIDAILSALSGTQGN